METLAVSAEINVPKTRKKDCETHWQTIKNVEAWYSAGLPWKSTACLLNIYFAAAEKFLKLKTGLLNEPDKLTLASYPITGHNHKRTDQELHWQTIYQNSK